MIQLQIEREICLGCVHGDEIDPKKRKCHVCKRNPCNKSKSKTPRDYYRLRNLSQYEFDRLMIDFLKCGFKYRPETAQGFKEDYLVIANWFDDPGGIIYSGKAPEFFKKFQKLLRFEILSYNPHNHTYRLKPKSVKSAIEELEGHLFCNGQCTFEKNLNKNWADENGTCKKECPYFDLPFRKTCKNCASRINNRNCAGCTIANGVPTDWTPSVVERAKI